MSLSVVRVIMFVVLAGQFQRHFGNARNRTVILAASANVVGSIAARKKHANGSTRTRTSTSLTNKVYRTVQVQIVHRHGDRSPITPLKDEEFWTSTLAQADSVDQVASLTEVVRKSGSVRHVADGRGPFGKLSQLGLEQMIELGAKLRERLATDDEDAIEIDENDGSLTYPHVWNPQRPLQPSNIRVFSTDFSRTILSVQGLLFGLFPNGTDTKIPIDTTFSNYMIPDPKPRHSEEQVVLEKELSARPSVLAKEHEMLPLAVRATEALHDMLAHDAREVSFGVGQENPGEMSIEIEPLGWNQLAEITKCLKVRNKLPAAISYEDQEKIVNHAAWRWFEMLTEPRMAYLSMNYMTSKQMKYLMNHETEPPVTVWSGHDSTLIGLMCAYRLEKPVAWPPYASYLMIELLEVSEEGTGTDKDYVLRFSLNGEVLKSKWNAAKEETIPLDVLSEELTKQEVEMS